MPRRTLKVLRACWATLAWLLFLTGVIGCDASPRSSFKTDTGVPAPAGSNGDAAAAEAVTHPDAAPTEAAPTEVAAETAPRPVFEKYDDVTSYYMGTYPFTPFAELIILASGEVYGASGRQLQQYLIGRATAEELAAFVEVATRPETLAAFSLTDETGCPMTSGDAYDDISVVIQGGPTYKRTGGEACPGLGPLQAAAALLRDKVNARKLDGGTPP